MKKIVVIAIMTLVSSAFMREKLLAQTRNRNPVVIQQQQAHPDLIRAQELEKQGKNDEAKALYEKLYETVKTDNVFWKLLLICEKTGDFDSMERLVRERLDLNPDDPSMQRYLARVYFSRGDKKEGRKILLDIIEGHWNDVGRAYLVANELSRQNDLDAVIDIYLRVRREIGNEKLFALPLAQIYAARTDYVKAIEEHLRQIEEIKSSYANVRTLIQKARDTGTSTGDIEKPIRKHLDAKPSSIAAARLLSELRYDAGDYDGAYEALLPAAVATGNSGDVSAIAGRFRDDGHFDHAMRAYEDFYRYFKDDPGRISALLDAASLREERGDIQGALDMYVRLAEDYRDTREGDLAVLRSIALTRSQGDFGIFETSLNDFAASTKYRDVAREAYMLLGRAHLKRGEDDKAGNAFEKARLKCASRSEKYDTAVQMALYRFFTGDFEGFKREVQNVVRNDPSGEAVNNLLEIKMLGMKCQSEADTRGLEALAAGRYAFFRGENAEAVRLLESAASDTASVAAAFAADALATMHLAGGDTVSAVEWYLKASSLADEPALAVGSVTDAADILADDPASRDRAVELYRTALAMAPGGVRESELRRKLMNLVEQ